MLQSVHGQRVREGYAKQSGNAYFYAPVYAGAFFISKKHTLEEKKMKKTVSILMVIAMLCAMCAGFAGCGGSDDTVTVGICQLMVHDSLDQATQGFVDALTSEMESAGKKVEFDTQVAGETGLCATVINTFTAKKVDLIMANATPALLAAQSHRPRRTPQLHRA